MVSRFLTNPSGATSIEYAMVAGFASIAILAGLRGIGVSLTSLFYGPLLGAFH